MTCQHFQDPAQHEKCACGQRYTAVAGGGAYYQVMRLPCIPISNRRGEVESKCQHYKPPT